jgi:hypothetical protein
MLELRLIHRRDGEEDVPIYVAIGEVYSPPEILSSEQAAQSGAWAACRVKVYEEEEGGSEILGANPLEALDHALLHVKSYLRLHMQDGTLHDIAGNVFDPDAVSGVLQARIDVERALRKTGRREK